MAQGPRIGEFMIGCQKGLIYCKITFENTFEIIQAIDDFVSIYCVNICWAGGMPYVVVTSRPRFATKRDIPPGEENYAVISYTVYDNDEPDPNRRLNILGQYRTNFT